MINNARVRNDFVVDNGKKRSTRYIDLVTPSIHFSHSLYGPWVLLLIDNSNKTDKVKWNNSKDNQQYKTDGKQMYISYAWISGVAARDWDGIKPESLIRTRDWNAGHHRFTYFVQFTHIAQLHTYYVYTNIHTFALGRSQWQFSLRDNFYGLVNRRWLGDSWAIYRFGSTSRPDRRMNRKWRRALVNLQ